MDMRFNAALSLLGSVVLIACGGDETTVQNVEQASCDADTTVLCICPGPTIGVQACDDGVPGECDCSDPIDPGECREQGVPAACICDDGQIGEQSCEGSEPGPCQCPEPLPAGTCRSDLDCSDGLFCNGVERCDPRADGADDNGCLPAAAPRTCDDGVACTIDRCSDALNRCVVEAPDMDADGHADASCLGAGGEPLGDDCDDADANRYPGNPEVCGEDDFDHDEDCDPNTFGSLDRDGDGAVDSRCCNGETCGVDCDDTTIARRAGQPEFCDNQDNDCDGEVDEETGAVPWYIDADGDGFGGIATMDTAEEKCIPVPGRSLLATDCVDDDPSRHPAQLERCDLRDNNCNLVADEGAACPYEPFEVAPDDEGGVDVGGGGDDTCPPYGYEDVDGDGFGDTDSAVALDPEAQDCGLPADWVTKGGDCDDGLANVNPGQVDACDLIDNDCDGVADQEPEASESCNIANIEAMCVLGECVAADGASCEAPYADCDGLANTGCEANTQTSALHCGGCDQACGLGDTCTGGSCDRSPYLDIVAGGYTTLLRRKAGLLGWGHSLDLQLGTGGTQLAPIRVGQIGATTEVAAGLYTVCLRVGGTVQCWGRDDWGQVGSGRVSGVDFSVPSTVEGIGDAARVYVGGYHACAVLQDRTAWCWGDGRYGQIGSRDPAPYSIGVPEQVAGVDDAIDMLLGYTVSCILHATGKVSCFGQDNAGQLGFEDGVNQNVLVPREVEGLGGVVRMGTGSGYNSHVCVILDSGGVSCWGSNSSGTLGNGDSGGAVYAPTVFQNVSNAKEVVLGQYHTCVLEADGDVFCAGNDAQGQVGDGAVGGSAPMPVQVDFGGAKAEHTAAGALHTCAILQDAGVRCWGNNYYGQIGAGPKSSNTATGVTITETLPAP